MSNMKALTLDDIKNRLKNMRVDNNVLYATKAFSFVVNDPNGDLKELKNVFISFAVTQYNENGKKERHYCSPGIVDKIQKIMDEYGEIYDIS